MENKGKLFGVAAECLPQSQRDEEGKGIPSVVSQILSKLHPHLTSAGLFVPGKANMKDLRDLKYILDKGEAFRWEEVTDPCLLLALLKIYLRELPQPLLSFRLYNSFLDGCDIEVKSHRDLHFSQVVEELPPLSKKFLEVLLRFLLRALQESASNGCSAETLARHFAPIFLRPEVETLETMAHSPKILSVVQQLLESDLEVLFPVWCMVSFFHSFSGVLNECSSLQRKKVYQPIILDESIMNATEEEVEDQYARALAGGGAEDGDAEQNALGELPPLPPLPIPPAPPTNNKDWVTPVLQEEASAFNPPTPPATVSTTSAAGRSEMEGGDGASGGDEERRKVQQAKVMVDKAIESIHQLLQQLETQLMETEETERVVAIALTVKKTRTLLFVEQQQSKERQG
ncbi:Rho GTPase-activating protein 22 [Balamuthia mandrillaris]